MKNITKLAERADIHRYVFNLWRTDLFRDAHNEGGFVYKIVDRMADTPVFFFDPTDKKLEAAHFSPWWGGIQRRDYVNDFIHDLYYLHEFVHKGEMPYIPGLEFENFKQKMFDNELLASTISEIQAYFEMPELRAKSFPQEIYADRFLNDPEFQARWKAEADRVFEELKIRRRNVMNDQHPNDEAEYWIRKFAAQNDGWASIWNDRYDEVETAMRRFNDRCRQVGRAQALDEHLEWLTSEQVTRGTDIPFPLEAEAFAALYWKNKTAYEEAIAAKLTAKKQAKPTSKKSAGRKKNTAPRLKNI